MDRPQSTRVPLPAADAVPGWDPHAVWRERIHAARAARPVSADAPAIALLDGSSGWDPLETWRIRVQRPRAADRAQ